MKLNRACPLAAPWVRALGRRIRTLWLLKMAGTTLGISGFFVLYFWVMHNPLTQAVTMPVTAVDRWIGVSELALLPYASLWFYVSLAPAFARDKAALFAYAEGAAIMAVMGLVVFWFFPTVVPDFAVDWSRFPAFGFLKSADAGGNAFPSLHVAFAAYTAVAIARQLRSLRSPAWPRWINRLWVVAIVWSTLATRQHVLADVAGGLALAAFASWASLPRETPLPAKARAPCTTWS